MYRVILWPIFCQENNQKLNRDCVEIIIDFMIKVDK